MHELMTLMLMMTEGDGGGMDDTVETLRQKIIEEQEKREQLEASQSELKKERDALKERNTNLLSKNAELYEKVTASTKQMDEAETKKEESKITVDDLKQDYFKNKK